MQCLNCKKPAGRYGRICAECRPKLAGTSRSKGGAGRPIIGADEMMVTTSISIPQADRDWLVDHYGAYSSGVRYLIAERRLADRPGASDV